MWLSDVTVRAPRLKRQSTTLAEPKPKLTLDGLFSAISCSSSGDGWFVVLLSKRGKAAKKQIVVKYQRTSYLGYLHSSQHRQKTFKNGSPVSVL